MRQKLSEGELADESGERAVVAATTNAERSTPAAELSAMSAASAAIEPLADPARHRVVRWLADVFGVRFPAVTNVPIPRPGDRRASTRTVDDPSGGAEAPANYETFAELFDRAQPRDDSERVLTAMYWLQVVVGASQTDSLHINKQLTDLGHRVDRIRNILPKLQITKPALVLQVSHGKGSSGHRIVKLSAAGIKAVESALAAGGFDKVV